jgi:tRNA threonylcarbamoyladenosine biosynthesis protein TsaE
MAGYFRKERNLTDASWESISSEMMSYNQLEEAKLDRMEIQEIHSSSAEDTFAIGKVLGQSLFPGALVALSGDLGAGKTCCIQGIAMGLGVEERSLITSPTFTLIQEYQGRLPIYHFDVYRLTHDAEMYDLGYEEYFYGEGVTLIEWAERVEAFLPQDCLQIQLHIEKDLSRTLRFCSIHEQYKQVFESLNAEKT